MATNTSIPGPTRCLTKHPVRVKHVQDMLPTMHIPLYELSAYGVLLSNFLDNIVQNCILVLSLTNRINGIIDSLRNAWWYSYVPL